ncbi:glutamate receptor-like protein [Trifolium pratense]|uniref:Glutamate receptor-like protein n=1 Tax=Trifolium pratense TaxID=57577 RepID=A0A2K3NDU2_TRIPR|nr:glutamate receptor-like protein [Trifolium pratense]
MMSQGYVWIVTDSMANLFSSFDFTVKESMEGVLGVRTYIPKTKKLDDFGVRWKRKFISENPTLVDTNLNIFGIWAYDATIALAMAIEKVGIGNTNFGYNESNTSSNYYMPNFEKFGIAQNGEKLSEALSKTRFKGLSGDFNVVDGKLQAPIFEIINVIGDEEKRVGFWTPNKGLARNLDRKGQISNNIIYSTSKNDLGSIIWPGDVYSISKGWEIPTVGKKLKIGVPVKYGDNYTEFLKITYDRSTNKTKATGFCIDVFKAVLDILPYELPYEFLAYAKPDGEMAGSYNDLISQIYYGNYDAVVGDVTIIANRSNYVDFTMPYTESGVTMVVSMKDNRKKNAWAFLKPLTWGLWVASACSLVFIGFVVWVLEHRVNNDFRGPPSHQIGTSLWFSFSTVVYAHREKVVSNLARFVVVVWLFVVLILVQSYTASLTSLLTVEQLSPTITDVNQLLKNKMNVGYLKGSFVYGILKNLGFPDSQLITYQSPEECNELFIKGSVNGGIDAAFDEVPYVKHFLGIYSCSKYVMVEPKFKTGGFGYLHCSHAEPNELRLNRFNQLNHTSEAFPKGSPLVADISRAILNVTQGGKIKTIENTWDLFPVSTPNLFGDLPISAQPHLKSENKKESSDSPCSFEASPGTHCPPSPSSQTESNVSVYGDFSFSPNIEMDVVQITNQEVAPVNNCEINSQATANMTSSTFVTSSP